MRWQENSSSRGGEGRGLGKVIHYIDASRSKGHVGLFISLKFPCFWHKHQRTAHGKRGRGERHKYECRERIVRKREAHVYIYYGGSAIGRE